MSFADYSALTTLARCGQLVVVGPDTTLLGVAYTQRIASSQAPLDVAAETPTGPILQLLGIVQRPGTRVGALLHTSTLLMGCLDETIERAYAVVRCIAYRTTSGIDFAAYVEEGTDPGLLFHTSAGAYVGDVIRDGNTDLVLVHYTLRRYHVSALVRVKAQVPTRLQLACTELLSAVSHFPGAPRAAALTQSSAASDAVLEAPTTRWEPLAAPLAARHGGFVAGAQRFDHAIFGVSLAEAHAMDPQQRLLLEAGYEATHGASLRRGELLGNDVGIFVGLSARGSVEGRPQPMMCSDSWWLTLP